MLLGNAALFVWSLLLVTVVFCYGAGNPLIHAKPVKFFPELSPSLEVNCSFTIVGTSNLADVGSLIIARSSDSGQTFTELASIIRYAPYKVNLLTSENVTATGFFSDSGESFLYLSWQYPSEDQSGMYRCSANGYDLTGRTKVITDTAVAYGKEATLGDYADMIRDMSLYVKQTMTELNSYVHSSECSSPETDKYFVNLERTMTDIDTSFKRFEEKARENYTKTLEQNAFEIGENCIVNGLETCDQSNDSEAQRSFCNLFRNHVLVYRDRHYYLSVSKPDNATAAAATCQTYGGYLVEINDLDEYHALRKFVNTTTGVTHVLIAGSDAASEGQWVFPSTNQALHVLDWSPGRPEVGTSLNCLFLYQNFQWKMGNHECSNYKSSVRFICEMP